MSQPNTAIIVGAGHRAITYASYAQRHPEQLQIVGVAEVRDVFRSSKLGNIAGCLVLEGSVQKDLPIRVLRDQTVIYEGVLESLRRFKDDVKKVEAGTECGIGVKNYNDIKSGDQVECFDRIEVRRTVSAEA